MIPTYVQHIPTGSETGTFLALDLGGTNLRVCEVTLLGEHKWTMKQQKYKVSDALKMGEVTALFDYIANSVDHFLTEIGTSAEEDEKLHLGFTFSFPVLQTALAAGTLINWTKVRPSMSCFGGAALLMRYRTQGFECKNAIGKDIVQLLQDAFDRKHIHGPSSRISCAAVPTDARFFPVRCSALVNDTCGTLMARAYEGGSCLCGGIFGTGTNGAYVEKLSKITKMEPGETDEEMVVNTECESFRGRGWSGS